MLIYLHVVFTAEDDEYEHVDDVGDDDGDQVGIRRRKRGVGDGDGDEDGDGGQEAFARLAAFVRSVLSRMPPSPAKRSPSSSSSYYDPLSRSDRSNIPIPYPRVGKRPSEEPLPVVYGRSGQRGGPARSVAVGGEAGWGVARKPIIPMARVGRKRARAGQPMIIPMARMGKRKEEKAKVGRKGWLALKRKEEEEEEEEEEEIERFLDQMGIWMLDLAKQVGGGGGEE